MRLLGATGSHVGNVREANQDRVYFGGSLAALADGMGGHQGGERAAELAIGQFRAAGIELSENDLVDVVLAANRAVHGHAADNGLPGMGTTLVALTLHADGTMTVANVGDSRAYWIRGDYLKQVTEDHSFVEDLVRQGRLSPEEAAIHPQRNILTRAVGIGVEVEVDRFPITEPEVGDRFLLCSDGLFNEVGEDEILDIILGAADPATAARELIEATLETPCRDNVTVAVVEVVADDDPRLAEQADDEDDGVTTSEFPDPDRTAEQDEVTAPVPAIRSDADPATESPSGAPADPAADPAADEGGEGDEGGDGGAERSAPDNGNGNGGSAAPLAAARAARGFGGDAAIDIRGQGPGARSAPARSAVAVADDDRADAAIDDAEAAVDTAEMELVVDDPREVRPRSRKVLAIGGLLLIGGLVAAAYFGGQLWYGAGAHLVEGDDGLVVITSGRPGGGPLGLYEPDPVEVTALTAADLATYDIEVDEHYADVAAAREQVAAIQEDLDRLAAEEAAREDDQADAAGPSAGTSEGTVDGSGSGSTQLTPTTVGEAVSGGIDSGGSGRSSTTRGG